MITIGCDPGPLESSYVMLSDEPRVILSHEDLGNEDMLKYIKDTWELLGEMGLEVACEMVQHYGTGMSVGSEVFQTVLWIGRFQQMAVSIGCPFHLIFRPTIKQHLCHSVRATDANVRQALIDLLGPGRYMEEVRKVNKKGHWQMVKRLAYGPTAGIHEHQWAALAVAVTRQAQVKALNPFPSPAGACVGAKVG